MAYKHTMTSSQTLLNYASPPSTSQRRLISKQRFLAEFSQCLFDFVIQLLPTAEEMAVKEDVRKLLERLIRTIEPDSRLLSFGSSANGFSLRNSDMDLCCLIDSEERLAASDLVTILGGLLERETKFHVKPLPHARIPIVKLSLDPSPGLPLGIACDIGFENRLALENTRLLMCYAMIDPTRVRTMVLFLKVWSKRRKINSPYTGTLSSYGYVLLVIYFLVHVKNPPILPNLQQIPPLRPISESDTHLNGHNIWFFDDIELLRQKWQSSNTESVAELLIDFFRYYARDFSYNTGVASIRAGLLKKESKGWQNDVKGYFSFMKRRHTHQKQLSSSRYNDARERNRFCVEDPFETDYNVARCVTKDGLYTIRGEFMRAARIVSSRPERAVAALAELCEERKEESASPAPVPPRLSIPPQTPYTVGNNSMRPKGAAAPEHFSPPTEFFEPRPPARAAPVTIREPPEHMAPKRGKWTSPPPPDASSAAHSLFEDQLGKGLELATAPSEARESTSYNSSSSNSEILTDDEAPSEPHDADDARSVQSFTEGSNSSPTGPFRRPVWLNEPPSTARLSPVANGLPEPFARMSPGNRGRLSARLAEKAAEHLAQPRPKFIQEPIALLPNSDFSRRSVSGPPRMSNRFSWSPGTPTAFALPLPSSPVHAPNISPSEVSSVFYQTKVPRPTIIYPIPGSQSSLISHSQQHYHPNPVGPLSKAASPSKRTLPIAHRGHKSPIEIVARRLSAGPDTPTPTSYSDYHHSQSPTIASATPLPYVSPKLTPPPSNDSHLERPLPTAKPLQISLPTTSRSASPLASLSNGSNSPSQCSTGYATSVSQSSSPSPSPSPTATLPNSEGEVIYLSSAPLKFASFGVRAKTALPPIVDSEPVDLREKTIPEPPRLIVGEN